MINRCITIKSDIHGLCHHQKLLNLNATTVSVFGGIMDINDELISCVASFLGCVLAISFISTISTTCDKRSFRISYPVFLVFFFTALVGLTIWSAILYKRLLGERTDSCKTDLNDLHKNMTSSLRDNFSSDNFTNGTSVSFEWNSLFIDYECCGVNKVTGTTNDFDNTPWCTTSGSCQATASQIPKTCCKGLNKYDYQSAPSACHSSVSPGYYYEKGCYSVIKKELIKEQIQFDTAVDYLLTEWFKVVLAMGFCSLLVFCGICDFIKLGLEAIRCKCTTHQNNSANRTDAVNSSNGRTPEINNRTASTPM